MTDQHPITPPPELIQQWVDSWYDAKVKHDELDTFITTQAARWGADQELEACCEWAGDGCAVMAIDLRDARRPKPPSLKEQALGAMGRFNTNAHTRADEMARDFDTIRRALEALPDD